MFTFLPNIISFFIIIFLNVNQAAPHDDKDSRETRARVFYGGNKTEHQKDLENSPGDLSSTLTGSYHNHGLNHGMTIRNISLPL